MDTETRKGMLSQMARVLSEEDRSCVELQDKVTRLTPYAVEIRYPELEEPLLEDAREAVEIAEQVRNFVLQRLGLGGVRDGA